MACDEHLKVNKQLIASMIRGAKSEPKVRSDGCKTLLVYMLPKVVLGLKRAALDENQNAYEIVEDAVSEWLAARSKPKKPKQRH